MKSTALLFAAIASLLTANAVAAADPVKIDLYVDGELRQQFSLVGPHSGSRFWLGEDPNHVFEVTMVAPEPIILDVREFTKGEEASTPAKRIKLVGKNDKIDLQPNPGQTLHHKYVLVRPE